MRLINTLLFVDASGRPWAAPKGSVVDGASIPRFMWRLIGSPFVGKYRRASVVHDVYCVTRERPHAEVHAMFCEAMKADGVGYWKRLAMCKAVSWFGPKW